AAAPRPPAVVAAQLPHHAARRQHPGDGPSAARRADPRQRAPIRRWRRPDRPDRRRRRLLSMAERAALDAGAIVGLLADDERRRVAAAIILGAGSADAVAAASGLALDRVTRALGRLADGGLVVDGAGGLSVDGAAFQRAARAARARPPRTEHAGESAERRKV